MVSCFHFYLSFAFANIWLRGAANHEPLFLWMGAKSNRSQTSSFFQEEILDQKYLLLEGSWTWSLNDNALGMRYGSCFLATEISVLIF